MTTSLSKQLGIETEELAYRYLIQQGLKLITRNYRCKLGEIDLIMRDKETIVFVEVRYRKQKTFGSSIESIDYFKQKKLIKTASYYLQTQQLYNTQACRFDVMAIAKQADTFKLEWLKNAFQVS